MSILALEGYYSIVETVDVGLHFLSLAYLKNNSVVVIIDCRTVVRLLTRLITLMKRKR